jgi:two-component system response regulator DesR
MRRAVALASEVDPQAERQNGYLRILVVEPREVVRCGFRSAFARYPTVERCLTAADAGEAADLVRRFEPHVAVVGLIPGSQAAVETARHLSELAPSTALLLLAENAEVSPAALIEARAVGWIDAADSLHSMFESVAAAAHGRPTKRRRESTREAKERLSDRELDVLRHMASGATNREIATQLHLSPDTIKQNTQAVFRKLNARNRTEAVRLAERFGLVSEASV